MNEPTTDADTAVVADTATPAEPPDSAGPETSGGWRGRKRYPSRQRPARARRRPGRRGVQVRDRLVQTRLTESGYTAVDARSEQARLAMGAWLALIGEDVALGRPALSETELEQLGHAAGRLARIGKSLNVLAAGENVGRAVPEPQIAAALTRLDQEVRHATAVLADVGDAYAAAAPTTMSRGGRWVSRGRRAPVDTTSDSPRRKVVWSRVSVREHQLLTEAAARQGLSVGAWLGTLAEGQIADRPAITGEQYAAVVRVRRALRRVATNLAQITQSRGARGVDTLPALVGTSAAVDATIRVALEVETAIADTTRPGARR